MNQLEERIVKEIDRLEKFKEFKLQYGERGWNSSPERHQLSLLKQIIWGIEQQ